MKGIRFLLVAVMMVISWDLYAENEPEANTLPSQGVSWDYAPKDSGPEHWGELSPEYKLCKEGHHQSPINIEESDPAEMAPLQFQYRAAPLEITRNGHTVEITYPERTSNLVIGEKKYDLIQIYFHTPSEHKINWSSYPMEIHLVHKDSQGGVAVVAVLVEEGQPNLAVQELWRHLPNKAGMTEHSQSVTVDPRGMLPGNQSYYRYVGSFTTPPCHEGIQWYLLKEPVALSSEQIKRFRNLIGMNARPIQPRNHRALLSDTPLN